VESESLPPQSRDQRLRELALLFLRLGSTSFGGPAAHIAMMENEVVRRRGWLTSEQFLDYVGATNLIPGPNSTEIAIHIGHARAGWGGPAGRGRVVHRPGHGPHHRGGLGVFWLSCAPISSNVLAGCPSRSFLMPSRSAR
jgi:Chromate transporter